MGLLNDNVHLSRCLLLITLQTIITVTKMITVPTKTITAMKAISSRVPICVGPGSGMYSGKSGHTSAQSPLQLRSQQVVTHNKK